MTQLGNSAGSIGLAASNHDVYEQNDPLFAGSQEVVSTYGTIGAGAFKRGTLLGRVTSGGALTICGAGVADNGGRTPRFVLAHDISADETNRRVGVYKAGCFNIDALIQGTTPYDLDGLRIAAEAAGVELSFDRPKTATPTEPAGDTPDSE